MLRCDGCRRALSVVEEAMGVNVCGECARARHFATVTGKCPCGRKQIRVRSTYPQVHGYIEIICARCGAVVERRPAVLCGGPPRRDH